jgi:hypothetical protein
MKTDATPPTTAEDWSDYFFDVMPSKVDFSLIGSEHDRKVFADFIRTIMTQASNAQN